MLNLALAKSLKLTYGEIEVLQRHKTPEEFQEFIRSLNYDFEIPGKEHYPSFRRALRECKAHCFAGTMMGAAYIYLHNIGPPLFLCIDACHGDADHNLAVYWQDGKVGSISASRHKELTGKAPAFRSYKELVMSYYPHYYNDNTNDKNDYTMRGFCAPIDLRIFGNRWVTGKRDLKIIENYLYSVPYEMLFLDREELYEGLPRAEGKYYYVPRRIALQETIQATDKLIRK